nr:MAG TPA: hypothetical protein [Caudoviricetes sp.]
MTNEEKLKILRDREDRAYELLRTLEPTDPAFGTCLDNSRRCMYARSEITMDDVDKQLCSEMFEPVPEAEQPQPDPADPAATWEPGGGEAVEEEPAPADAPAQEEAEAESPATNEEPQPTLTKTEVLAQLTPISIKYGSLVADVMNEMGYAKLSSIPAKRYGELLKKVGEAVRCRQ